jgi:hypothetical protein
MLYKLYTVVKGDSMKDYIYGTIFSIAIGLILASIWIYAKAWY